MDLQLAELPQGALSWQPQYVIPLIVSLSNGQKVNVQFGGLNLPTNQVIVSDKVNPSAIFK